LLLAACLLVGCYHPAQVVIWLDCIRTTPDEAEVAVKVKNLENRATTPLAITLSIESWQDGAWGKPVLLLHPAPFVLNRHEEHVLTAPLKAPGAMIRGFVQITEQESGRLLQSVTLDRSVRTPPAKPATPSHAKPGLATPPRRGT
jgi:hypothetical protein